MKALQFTPRVLLSIAALLLGLIIAAVPKNTTTPFKLSADQILNELKSGTQFVEPDLIAQMIVEGDPTLRLIDVRPQDEFEKYSLPGAINIPINEILSHEFEEIVNQGLYSNVIYTNGSTRANEAWMLLRQLGYNNNYVLRGGLNYWFENILNPQAPEATSPDDELAKYDFRKAASQALGGGGLVVSQGITTAPAAPLPRPQPQKERQAVKGGC